MKKKSYCFVAGQSGGHIIPCIALAEQVIQKQPIAHILFFTTTHTLDRSITRNLTNNYTLISLPITAMTRITPYTFIKMVYHLCIAWGISMYYLMQYTPQSITSTGGICAIPVAIAGYMLRIPIDLYELNVLPGKTISFLSTIARTVYCCFERTLHFLPKAHGRQAVYPLRAIHQRLSTRHNNNATKNILIIGGSQGSLFINNAIKQWLDTEPAKHHFFIMHQTGSIDTTHWQQWYAQRGISATVFSFTDTLHTYYTQADLVICRSGAGSLFEAAYYHIPCITIPLESAHNTHQIHNAFTVAQNNPTLFHVITQSTITNNPTILATYIHTLLPICSHPSIQHAQEKSSSVS